MDETEAVRGQLQRFQDGYTLRDPARLDDFMQLFVQSEEIELIGVGAVKRGGNEWFQGLSQIREIIEGDWQYWGDVRLDVADAKISVRGETAWLTTCGDLLSSEHYEKALPFYLDTMKKTLEDESLEIWDRLAEASFFGVSRMRDQFKPSGLSLAIYFLCRPDKNRGQDGSSIRSTGLSLLPETSRSHLNI